MSWSIVLPALLQLGLSSALSIPHSLDLDSNQSPFQFDAPNPADLPHANPTHSFWTHSPGANPLAGEGSTGPLTGQADVCIIGSGITGVSAAYHLANAVESGVFPSTESGKVSAVILEARDFCSGATGRNGGNLTPYAFGGFGKLQERFGTDAALRQFALEHYSATEMARIARESGWADAVDLVEGGHVDIMLNDSDLAKAQADFFAAIFAGKDINATWFSQEDMNATYGTYNWGVRSPGYNLWPLKFVTQLYKSTLGITPRLDLRLHTRTPVTAVSPLTAAASNRRWRLATPRGAVLCSTVLHATNGYASHLLPQFAGPENGITPVRGQVLAVRAETQLPVPSWSGNEGYWFPRPQTASEDAKPLVILGGKRSVAGPPYEMGVTDDGVLTESVGAALRNFLPEMFPGLYKFGVEPEAEWTGIMGYTALEIPFVGPVLSNATADLHDTTFKGQYISAGYHGHGMPRAFGCAEVVVRMIADERAGWDSPSALPEWFPQPFLTWVRDKKGPEA
ncbi:FAD dependent oxidoreductase [Favolaschia claudopus]|uniref:FAD dependent oxidoreductase n=1 Tax=Favolaschia claudopus TaxID=2862362 RepID=A0AAW0BGX6_9AGAR